jgi:large repetitive protein
MNLRYGLSAGNNCVLQIFFFVLFSIVIPAASQAQSSARVIGAVDDKIVTVMHGSRHPLATAFNEIGRVDSGLPMERMMLLLQPTAQQETALAKLVSHQSDKDSADYHRWLSPDDFGARFGPAQQDIDRVTAWLQSHGFTVNSIARGKQWIEFSGTAGQVESAFHTEIHQYMVKGEQHVANSTDISLPKALTPIIKGVLSLHNFEKRPLHNDGFKVRRDNETGKLVPEFTFTNSNGVPFHFLAPGDFSRIYNTLPLLNAGINGKGTSIAIVARSNIQLSDVQIFRQIFGLPANDPNFVFNGADPGPTGTGDEVEADLDTQWSGAVAPQAKIDLVITGSTFSSDGSDLSLAYIVDHRVAPILSSSFGQCEAFLGPAGNDFFRRAYEQAAAEGITVFVSAGDDGAAGCDNPPGGRLGPAGFGLNVSGIASTPFNIAVGGTQFAEQGNDSNFWLTSNRPGFSSAIGYIPESVWNESCDPTIDPNQCGDGLFSLFAGSGGKSSCVEFQIVGNTITCVSGYPKPSWQVGDHVPDDGVRDLPDVSLTAAGNHDGYLLCVEGACQTTVSGGKPFLESAFVVGGTSASAPAMAGIMALNEQKNGAFQGLANFNFYQLAATDSVSNCNSTLLTSQMQRQNCIFQDVTQGSNSVPGQVGFKASPGFDLSTGLGSVNANKLVNSWGSGNKLATKTSLSISMATIEHGQPLPLNVLVKPVSTHGTPSGDFDLFAGASTSIFGGSLSRGAFSGNVNDLPGGQYMMEAHYGGDQMFAVSDSNSVALRVTPEPSAVTLTGFEINLAGFVAPLKSPVLYGQPVALQFDVAGSSGVGSPTGTVTVSDNHTPIGTFQLNQGGNTFAQIDNITATGLLVGHHDITVVYNGDKSFLPSRPARLAFGVVKEQPRGFIFPVPGAATAGAPVRFLLSVLAPGQEIPTGTIQMFDNGVRIGTLLALQPQGAQGPGIAQAVFTKSFSAGDHVIAFTYSGDKNFTSISLGGFNAGQIDLPVSAVSGQKTIIQVQQTPTIVALSQSANYAVSVRPGVTGGTVPKGTVSLVGANGFVFGGPVALVNGSATVPLTFDAAGKFEIAASYSGDSHYSPFSSSILTTSVNRGTPIVTLKTAATTVQQGMQTSFSVSVVGRPDMPSISIPFGFVQFFDAVNGASSQPLGSAQFLTVGNGGNPILAVPVTLPAGENLIKAKYLGSQDWAPTFSNEVMVTVRP